MESPITMLRCPDTITPKELYSLLRGNSPFSLTAPENPSHSMHHDDEGEDDVGGGGCLFTAWKYCS